MKRRTYLKTMLAGSVAAAAGPASAADAGRGIQLHCDLAIDSAKEQQFLKHFHDVFKPAAKKFGGGYIDVKVIKLRQAVMGKPPAAPAGLNYRFVLLYQSEEQRQKWINSDVHKKVWPPIEDMMSDKNYVCLLFDVPAEGA